VASLFLAEYNGGLTVMIQCAIAKLRSCEHTCVTNTDYEKYVIEYNTSVYYVT